MVPRVARGVSLKCTRPQTWSPSVLGYRRAFKTRPGCGCTLIATGLNRGTALSCRDNTRRSTNYSLQDHLRQTAGAKRRLLRDKREELGVARGGDRSPGGDAVAEETGGVGAATGSWPLPQEAHTTARADERRTPRPPTTRTPPPSSTTCPWI